MLYSFARAILLVIVKILFFFEVSGHENIPKEGAAVICANHKSFWDPIMIGVALKRQPGYIAKEELFRFKPFGAILRKLGVFPLKRGNSDLGAVKTAVVLLKSGKLFMIFPEGTRVKKGRYVAPKTGFVRIAKMTDSPIIPVGINGGFKLFKKVRVVIGKPITLQLNKGEKAGEGEYRSLANGIMDKVYELAGEEYEHKTC